jgi:hypothetical protein
MSKNLPLEKLAISVAETARRLDCGVFKIRSMIDAGHLQTITLGSRELVTVVSIENLIDRMQQPVPVGTVAPAVVTPTDPADAMRQLAEECAAPAAE